MWAYPPSGPMDNDSHRLANSLLDNPINAAALEMTYSGAKLNFRSDTVIALTGAPMKALLDDQEISFNQAVKVKAGGILSMGKVQGFGQRSYLAVQGGFDAPLYLGSASTFTLGGFGGLQGRALLPGDILPFGHQTSTVSTDPSVYKPQAEIQFPQGIPLSDHWRIRVLIGPHGAPEYFLPEDMDAIFGADWTVNFNSSRTGVRLDGPKPQWARQDGGEAGLHPSNIHDNAYAIGSLDFTGDMPVILGPDGPSLGGFVCPAVVISRDLWILGQLKAGDRIRFVPVGLEQALGEEDSSKKNIKPPNWRYHKAVIHRATSKGILPQWELRRQGDANLLLEIGPMKLDLTLRFLIQGLLEILKAGGNPGGPDHLRGIIDLTPGIRSLQIHYDPRWLSENLLITFLSESMEKLAHMQDFNVPSRIVHLPLSWDDPATQLAIQRYLQGVRPNAPWGPSNIEFIRRINGLKDEKAVQDILFSSHYLVLGLGDVYLGAPVATPMDPRQRLVTTKYNPARTWTPENAVGIGGAYLCVYGMEGPGGYQFVGRTLQMWNRHHVTEHFPQGKPWLLNFFDQLKFYPVSQEELLDIRRRFPLGEFPLKVEETSLNFHQFQLEQSRLIQAAEAFTQSRSEAYAQERQRWVDQGLDTYEAVESQDKQEIELQDDWEVLESPMGGSIWKILCSENEDFASEAPLLVLESMKMEVEIPCENAGNVKKILVAKGQVIKPGDPLIAYKAKT
jgi:urea carboxylase